MTYVDLEIFATNLYYLHLLVWHGTAQNKTTFTLDKFVYVRNNLARHATSCELCLFM